MKDDVRASVKDFFSTCHLPAVINSTIVALVPKSKNIILWLILGQFLTAM